MRHSADSSMCQRVHAEHSVQSYIPQRLRAHLLADKSRLRYQKSVSEEDKYASCEPKDLGII